MVLRQYINAVNLRYGKAKRVILCRYRLIQAKGSIASKRMDIGSQGIAIFNLCYFFSI